MSNCNCLSPPCLPFQNHAQNILVCMNCARIVGKQGAFEECCADRSHTLNWCRWMYELNGAN